MWPQKCGSEILEKATFLDLLIVLLDYIGVIRVNNERVKLGGLDDSSSWRGGQVLLLVFSSLWVLVIKDEMNLVGVATLIRAKHDYVGRGVREFILVESLVVPKELHIRSTTFKTICYQVS
jgi:hypothetical protein